MKIHTEILNKRARNEVFSYLQGKNQIVDFSITYISSLTKKLTLNMF